MSSHYQAYQNSAPLDPADFFLKFLGGFFMEPATIVRSMAANCVLMSGPHVVHTFFAWSPVSSSDSLIFYVPDSEECISAFLLALEEGGVVFEDIYQPFRMLLATAWSGDSKPMHILHSDMKSYFAMNNDRIFQAGRVPGIESDDISELLTKIKESMDERGWSDDEEGNDTAEPIVLDVGGCKLLIHHDVPQTVKVCSLQVPDNESSVIHGQISYMGGLLDIEVVSGAELLPIHHILSEPCTHLQCFASAYGTAHLYHEPTSQRRTYLWGNNTSKFQAPSGYSWCSRPQNPQLSTVRGLDSRQYSGAEAIPFNFNFDLGVADQRIKFRTEALHRLFWLQNGFKSWKVDHLELREWLFEGLRVNEVTEARMHPRIGLFVAKFIFPDLIDPPSMLRDDILPF